MRVAVWVVVLVLWVSLAVAAPEIELQVHAVPTGDNLIANPGFEQGESEWPDGWSCTSNQPTGVTRVWSDHALSGKRSAEVVNTTTAGSGYWLQRVAVEPNREYLLTARTLIEGGKVLVRALGERDGQTLRGFDRRAYDMHVLSDPLVPVFWRAEWVMGMTREPWAPVNLIFSTATDPAPQSVMVHLGSYFAPGTCWFDDAYLGPGTLTLGYHVTGPVARVQVLDAHGKVLGDSGALAAGATDCQGEVEGLPLGGRYRVQATGPGGEVADAWYPAPQGGE